MHQQKQTNTKPDRADYPESIMLRYTTREINRTFKIKISGVLDGSKINTLVGVRGFLEYVNDIELANRLLDRAFASCEDKEICKLRRGIKVSFYFC